MPSILTNLRNTLQKITPNEQIHTKQTVESKIYYKPNKEQFIVAYGHTKGNPTSIGKGDTLQKALKDTANVIDEPTRQDARTRRKRLKNTQTTSLKLNLYYNEVEEHYTFAIKDQHDTEITGTGRSTSHAIKDLAEKVNLKNIH